MNKGIKKLVNSTSRKLNLAKYDDIAELVLGAGKSGAYSSESEADDLPDSKVNLPDDYQGRKKNSSCAIRLHEVGPRMRLELIKIQEGFCKGNVVYHSIVEKSKKEILEQSREINKRRKEKEERKKIQEKNVKAKLDKKEQEKVKSKEAHKVRFA